MEKELITMLLESQSFGTLNAECHLLCECIRMQFLKSDLHRCLSCFSVDEGVDQWCIPSFFPGCRNCCLPCMGVPVMDFSNISKNVDRLAQLWSEQVICNITVIFLQQLSDLFPWGIVGRRGIRAHVEVQRKE